MRNGVLQGLAPAPAPAPAFEGGAFCPHGAARRCLDAIHRHCAFWRNLAALVLGPGTQRMIIWAADRLLS